MAPAQDLDAGGPVVACVSGDVEAKPTPLYVELVVRGLADPVVRRRIVGAIDKMRFDDPAFALGFKPSADPDVDDAGLRTAARDGGDRAQQAYQQRLRDFPQLLTDPRFVAFEDVVRRAAAAPEARAYGTPAQYEQLRAWVPPPGLAPNGRRAVLIVSVNARPDDPSGPTFGSLQPLDEFLREVPVATGFLDLRAHWVARGYWTGVQDDMTALGMHGDPECQALEEATVTPPPTGTAAYGPTAHPLCIPTLRFDRDGNLHGGAMADATAAVLAELAACEYQVADYDARSGAKITLKIKGPDRFDRPLTQLTDPGAARPIGPRGVRGQPSGFVFDSPVRPTKVTITGDACLQLRRDQRRVLQISTTCP